jgi:hypothetical protein
MHHVFDGLVEVGEAAAADHGIVSYLAVAVDLEAQADASLLAASG